MYEDIWKDDSYRIVPQETIHRELCCMLQNILKLAVEPWHDKFIADPTLKIQIASLYAKSSKQLVRAICESRSDQYLISELPNQLISHFQGVRLSIAISQTNLCNGRSNDEIFLDVIGHKGMRSTLFLADSDNRRVDLARNLVDKVLQETLPVEELSSACLRTFLRETIAKICIYNIIEMCAEPQFLFGVLVKFLDDKYEKADVRPKTNAQKIYNTISIYKRLLLFIYKHNTWLLLLFVILDEPILFHIFVLIRTIFPKYPTASCEDLFSLEKLVEIALKDINRHLAEKISTNVKKTKTVELVTFQECASCLKNKIFGKYLGNFIPRSYIENILELLNSKIVNSSMYYAILGNFAQQLF